MRVLVYTAAPLLFYLAGSIPFALITGKITRGIDIREMGSGNSGAGNSFRVLGPAAGAAVLALDFLKGYLPVLFLGLLLGSLEAPETPWAGGNAAEILTVLCILCLIAGHALPVFASFRGGKGAACSAGAVTALIPPAAPVCLAVFILVLLLSSYLSLASLCAAWALPPAYMLVSAGEEFSTVYLLFFLAAALLITILHRKNIGRLLKGKERKTRLFPR